MPAFHLLQPARSINSMRRPAESFATVGSVQSTRFKSVASRNFAFLESALEPFHPLRGRTMSEGVRRSRSAGHALDSIVTNGCRRPHSLLKIAGFDFDLP